MCGLIAAFDKETLKHLFEINSYRGSLSQSITMMLRGGVQSTQRTQGEFSNEAMEALPSTGRFFIGHSQAPTGNESKIHPARIDDCRLWHNGLVKKQHLSDGFYWDTSWLLNGIADKSYKEQCDFLSDVDGSFACFYQNAERELFVFRNELCPLFFSDRAISSTKDEGLESLPPNILYRLEKKGIEEGHLVMTSVGTFRTKDNPYYFL